MNEKLKRSKSIKEEMSRRVREGEEPSKVAKDLGVKLVQPLDEHELQPSFDKFIDELTDETIIKFTKK